MGYSHKENISAVWITTAFWASYPATIYNYLLKI